MRLPLLPTAIVGLAVAAMIGLGVWQLEVRLPEKRALLAQLAANPARPEIAFPTVPDQALLFRRSTAMCLEAVSTRLEGAGAAGFRVIAECRTGAEGPGMLVQLGTTRDPKARVTWRGGLVRGRIGLAPSDRSLLAGLFSHVPDRLMLVAEAPVAGLTANAQPNPDSIPNNHLAYGVQWFLFAGVALVIYLLALRWRSKRPQKSL